MADGISNSKRIDKVSKLAMQILSQMEIISRKTIKDLQFSISAELPDDYHSSVTTFVAAEIDHISLKGKILSVGNSYTYLIEVEGKYQQITQDHSINSKLLDDFYDKKEEDLDTIDSGITYCEVED